MHDGYSLAYRLVCIFLMPSERKPSHGNLLTGELCVLASRVYFGLVAIFRSFLLR